MPHHTTLPYIIQPGWNDSPPDHWQSHWQARLPAIRVGNADWHRPSLPDWLAGLDNALDKAGSPAVVIAHSLGAITVAHYARHRPERIRAALLVAPADVERADAPPQITGFAPLPREPLPFPSLVVASTDDPYCPAERAAALASDWDAELVWLPCAGHINAASGHTRWEEGLYLLEGLLGHRVVTRERATSRVP
ncbi:RBBP9/YdeN family alpha/beta hydrolase [Paludibacterium paludis]|uniref:Alpha/beta hydrolase n=1 Tax=Paludibacterium paludis TaxID=1225769 RepID=A0A918U8S3_9NEIS|nr:alpha/beta hydrolase [Paludibacterium paludis]GGY12606.1 alpha/beta hydrolase [Paludibacterium paludis]